MITNGVASEYDYKMERPLPQYGENTFQTIKIPDDVVKQIRADVIEEFLKKDKECQESTLDCPYANSEIGCLECIAEQLKKQESIIEDLKPRGCADMPKEIICNCTKE